MHLSNLAFFHKNHIKTLRANEVEICPDSGQVFSMGALHFNKFALPAVVVSCIGVGIDIMGNSLAGAYPHAPQFLWRFLFWGGAALISAFPLWIIFRLAWPLTEIPVPSDWWSWPPLTNREINRLFAQLRAIPKPSQKIRIVGLTTSTDLRISFQKLFDRLEWPSFTTLAPPGDPIESGVFVSPDYDAASMLKTAIEKTTKIKITIVAPLQSPIMPVLMIGAKPQQKPIPRELKQELVVLGRGMKTLASDLLDFAAERAQASVKTPTDLTAPDMMKAIWDKRVKFSQETESLRARRFGAREISYLAALERMGISQNFFVQADKGRPDRAGKWFNLIGDLIESGNLEEAIATCVDTHFWFSQ